MQIIGEFVKFDDRPPAEGQQVLIITLMGFYGVRWYKRGTFIDNFDGTLGVTKDLSFMDSANIVDFYEGCLMWAPIHIDSHEILKQYGVT